MTLLIEGASCSLYTCHSMHTWPYFTWYSILLLSLVFYLSVYITIRFIIHSFLALLILPIYFLISILLFPFFVCALVRFWRTLIFQHQSFRRPMSHCSKEPKGDYQAWVWNFLSYIFWHFVLLWWPDVKIVSFVFLLCYISSLVSRQRLL